MNNIVISGYYGSKNAGDEAMLSAMLEVFSELNPKLHITVISSAVSPLNPLSVIMALTSSNP